MSKIVIAGCTTDLMSDDRPAISVWGAECAGKTRFAATAPGPIGLLALDRKSKKTMREVAGGLGTEVIANEKPFISDKEAIEMALINGDTPQNLAKIKSTYTGVVERIFDTAMKFAENRDIQTVVMDTSSQFFEIVLFSHFGRRNQITPTSRGAANQDVIDLVNAMRTKNLILIHRAKEMWKATGQYDKQGNAIKEPSGRFESDGYKNIGGFMTATLELTSKRTKTDDLESKFRVKCVTSQSNVLMEGQDLHEYGISGAAITWDNIITILGLESE